MKKRLLIMLAIAHWFSANAQSWMQVQKISTSDGVAETWKGSSVSMDSNYIVVGSTVADNGVVYIFEMDEKGEWLEIQKIVSSDIEENSKNFGESVSIYDDIIVIGDPGYYVFDGVRVDRAGAIFVFQKDEEGVWQFGQKILASDWSDGDRFGTSVSVSEDYIIAAAPFDDIVESGEGILIDAGSAYIFEREENGNWSEVKKITESDPQEGGLFGWSVSMSSGKAIVGAVHEHSGTSGGDSTIQTGSAYIFERGLDGNWIVVSKLLPLHQNPGASFGWSVSLDDDYAIVGSPWDETDALGENVLDAAGASYIFKRLNQGTWGEVQKIVASDRMRPGYFGWSVSIDRNMALVGGVLQENTGIGQSGAVYVYERDESDSWLEVQRILPNEAKSNDWVGYSVAVSGNLAFVGKRQDPGYIFERTEVSASNYARYDELIDIFPNPTNRSIVVDLGREYQFVDITLLNATGQVWGTKKFTNTDRIKLDLPEYLGVHILKIDTNDGISSVFRVIRN